ncbi:MAG TPA: hypothetical protein VKZ53_10530 [Candidatus Angelobacter sp.]|nr:hypothetical protein [Candidatus Angelobacter sp.]
MNDTSRSGSMLRNLGAVFAGLLVGLVLTLGTDAVMHATHVFPALGFTMSAGLFVLATAYRSVYSFLGSYVVARLAATRTMSYALALGVMNGITCVVGTAVTWNRGAQFGPKWYPLSLIVLAMPCAWLGGKLAGKKGGSDFVIGSKLPMEALKAH